MKNADLDTVEGFGQEWAAFDQSGMGKKEQARLFELYFAVFPFDKLPENAQGFDLGCGSGRWADVFAPKVSKLHCIDPAIEALDVAKRRLSSHKNIEFHHAGSDTIPLKDESQDFGYSLGVLHHIPDTELAMMDCVKKLKPGAPFLVYLYYNFDNRPKWYGLVWKTSDLIRKAICKLPFKIKIFVTTILAGLLYFPLARLAWLFEKIGLPVKNIPLHAYRNRSFYTMRTDSLDRFGTRLEHRFSRQDIEEMMTRCGLNEIVFHEGMPYWVACGFKNI